MTIICAMLTLDYAGVPTYVLTLTRELERRGHRVVVYCPWASGGRPLASEFELCETADGLSTPDAMIAHHTTCAELLRERFPDVPLIFVAHGVFSPESAPPKVQVDRYIAINEQTVNRLTEQNVPLDRIDLVRDFVDTERFAPTKPIRTEQPRVLFLSNYKRWNNYFYPIDACASLGLRFKAVGSPYGRSVVVEREINGADLVLSWGRGVLEAMACGRAVISYDMARFEKGEPSKVVGDGYLTIGRYHESRKHNFGPVGCRRLFKCAEDVAEQIRLYSPNDGPVNRALALKYHGHIEGVSNVLACIERARQAVAAC